MLLVLLVFLVALVVLIKGSDLFVESTARIAERIGVSEFVIGLTFVSIGTSLPELVTSLIASYSGNQDLVVGNIVGSNIANIGLILGISAVLAPLVIDEKIFYRDGLIMLGVSTIFLLLSLDMLISRLEGMVLLVIFFIYLSFLFELFSRLREQFELHEYMGEFFGFRRLIRAQMIWEILGRGIDVNTYRRLLDSGVKLGSTSVDMVKKGLQIGTYYSIISQLYNRLRMGLLRDTVLSLIALAAVFVGAKYVVESASEISLQVGVPQTVVGLIMVAVGTSLPELMVSLSAVRKGFVHLLVGNIVGSNITNITLVPGISSLISPITLTGLSVYRTIPTMILFSFTALLFIKLDWKITRKEGVMLIIGYLLFLAYILAIT